MNWGLSRDGEARRRSLGSRPGVGYGQAGGGATRPRPWLAWRVAPVKALLLPCRVSSVLNRNSRQFGKKYLFDEDEETCWNSDQVRRFHFPPSQV